MRRARRLALGCVLALGLPGCAVGPSWQDPVALAPAASSAPLAPAAAPARQDAVAAALIATLRGPTRVLTAPRGALLTVQAAQTDEGSRQSLLVLHDRQEWLQVALPGRPNGRSGWVRAGDVDLSATDWHLSVSLRNERLTVRRGEMLYGTYPVAVGRPSTPTPTGLFFITDLLAPPDPEGAYGPFAFGLSAYSDVLTSFGSGKGQIGLHGTDETASIGRPVSNGCLRLDNSTVRTLAGQLPLGTPVEIRA